MIRDPARRVLVPCISALAVVLAFGGACHLGRGQEPAAPAPQPIGASELLRSLPFDRLTLMDNTVLIIDPVSPRPLPVIDPKKERERKKKGTKNAQTLIEVGGKKQAEDEKEDVEGLETVKIHLLEGGRNEVRDFLVKRSSIKKIEYFEDMLMEEADRLILARDFARAFECCLRVKSRNPSWPGLDDHVNRVLFAEGRRALVDGDDERGLRLLRELLGRKRDYPGLLDLIGEAYGKRVERAIRMGLYLRGRRVLHELEEVTGEIAAVRALRSLFVARATDRLKQGQSAGPAERLDALTDALRIWPTLPGAEEEYNKAFQAEPTLEVGVSDVSASVGPWVHSRADARLTRLLYLSLLSADDQESRQGKRLGQLAASIETSDLGRRMLIRLRPGPTWSDGSRPVSASDVAHSLIERSDPHSPSYEARWADLLDRVEMKDEARLEVRLNHTPLRAGGWLLGPVGPAHAGIDGRVATSSRDRVLVTSGLYRCVQSSADSLELRVRDDRPGDTAPGSGGASPKVRRVRELRLSKGLAAVTALRRGDVSMIDHVPPDQVASLAESPDIQVGRYTQPVVHVISLDGRTPALRNRTLRRGLSYAVHRQGLLEDVILKHPANDVDRPADGPFPKGSFADAPGVKPLGFDIVLARMLVVAAKKELGNRAIRLTFEYPAIPECRAVAGKLAEAFRAAGVEIEPVEVPESRLESELRAGRRFDLAYRVLRSDDPIQDAGTLLCPAYDAPPETDPLASSASPRILQLLLQLERAGDWPTARGLVTQIDRESRDELAVIPLWQLADHYAWRTRLQGPGQTADQLYQSIEGWEIRPWIARDPWESAAKQVSSVGGGSVPRPDPIRTVRRTEPPPTTDPIRSSGGGGSVPRPDPIRTVRRLAHSLMACLLMAVSEGSGQEPSEAVNAPGRGSSQPGPTKPAPAKPEAPPPGPTPESQSSSSSAAEPIERQPYRIVFHFACHPASRIDPARRADLLRDWQVMVRRFVGVPWSVSIAPPSGPVLDIDLEGLEKATPAQAAAFEKTVEASSYDKVWVVHADRSQSGVGVMFTGREYDTATRRLGPLQRRSVEVFADAPRALLEFTLDLFSPTALISGEEGGQALLTVRGSAIDPASPIGSVVTTGTVFQPLRLISAKDGKTVVKIIPWTYLRVESIDGPVARCAIVSGLRDPLSKRFLQPNSLAAVGIKPGKSPLRLRFVTFKDKAPGAGYTLTARTVPNGTSREIGMTDRGGRIVLKPGFADSLVILRLLAGSVEPVAELPVMPGESSEERTIPFEPKYESVALEAEVDSLRDEVVDLIALRARLEARMKARLEGEDWDGLDQAIKEFSHLTPRDEHAKKLTELRERATREQAASKKAILTKNAQAQINDLQSMIDRYLDDEAFKAYQEALARGRSEQGEKAKAQTVAAAAAPKAARITPPPAERPKAAPPAKAAAPPKAAPAEAPKPKANPPAPSAPTVPF